MRNFLSAATCVGILSATFLAGYALAESRAPKEPKGIKIENLGTMDLAGELESLDGLKLHLDRLTVQPGGMSPFHSHKGRPQIVYMVQGSYLSHAEGKPDEVLRKGDVASGGKDRNHWIENVGSETAVALVFFVSKQFDLKSASGAALRSMVAPPGALPVSQVTANKSSVAFQYVTDDGPDGNPWDDLSTYLDTLLSL